MATNGLCQSPFLQEDYFPPTGGFVDGRYCQKFPVNGSSISCCLPCPLADWRYADDVAQKADVAGWISVAILPLCVFLLVSYAVLPVKWTNRHYLSICFTLGICCMEIAFIIPLGAKPNQCHNAITPNDMYSDLSCAFSGSFLLFGGWLVVIWSFIRTLAFHLQVCWEIVLGPKFMWGAFICGFGIPAIGLTVMLILTGVSFRFGDICHINTAHGTQDYWAPIMAFAAAALVLQLVTMVYCMHIYLRSLFDKSTPTVDNSNNNNAGRPSYNPSVRSATARQAYRRVRRVLQLQWRGATLVLIIIANVIFFAVVFTHMDREVEPTAANMDKAKPWLMCLTIRSKQECMKLASGLGPNETTILAVVYLLSLVGFWNFILFARPSMFAGWLDLYRRGFARPNEPVPADAPGRYADHKGFEMLTTTVKTSDTYMRSPSPTGPSPSPTPDRNVHFGQETRYIRPSMSFSRPRPPSVSQGREWDPSSTFARGYAR